MKKHGPSYGYFPQPSKTCLIIKEKDNEKFRDMFPDVNIMTDGHRYLGSFIRTESGKNTFVEGKINEWIDDVNSIIEAADTEPQLAYAAYIYGVCRKWNYLMRTTPIIACLLQKIENVIKEYLIPKFIGNHITDDERKIYSLSVKHGGIGIDNPTEIADIELGNSLRVNR